MITPAIRPVCQRADRRVVLISVCSPASSLTCHSISGLIFMDEKGKLKSEFHYSSGYLLRIGCQPLLPLLLEVGSAKIESRLNDLRQRFFAREVIQEVHHGRCAKPILNERNNRISLLRSRRSLRVTEKRSIR